MKEKAYSCSICNKKFHLKGNFKNHLKIHSEEKPFKCHYGSCLKCFPTKAQLINHAIRHYKSKCNICNNFFVFKVEFLRHMNSCNLERDVGLILRKDDEDTITDESS